jgi:hypothetical protein
MDISKTRRQEHSQPLNALGQAIATLLVAACIFACILMLAVPFASIAARAVYRGF